MTTPGNPDLIIVGAGIVGLAHAYEAHRRGMKVMVLERDERAVGASVRNFGHVCTTGQSGQGLEYAREARERWLGLSDPAGFAVVQQGTVVVARTSDELAVLEEFADVRGRDEATPLSLAQVEQRIGWLPPGTVGGAHLPLDLRVDPRAAVPALAAWLQSQGVEIRFGVNAGQIADGTVLTSVGTFEAPLIIHCVGHDVDRLFPTIAEKYQIRRCRLQMFEVAPPVAEPIGPAVLTGTSLLRYGGFTGMPSAEQVRAAFTNDQPELLEIGLNLMLTQRPDGSVVLGDSHHYERTNPPFDDESVASILLREGERLFGRPITVRKRWRGVYASSNLTDFLVEPVDARTHVVSVTSGIGMTTALGLAPAALDRILG
ncbi:oxidase [Nocardioides baekrokdamisoli]|uniref:Oxidase n=1 Tax=Nocardioides baekrokdamisoli TaxID=1804624 RepID=A0A3G9IYS1_9ACTN|nr:TIGR03364 family FAD-dependent oxidoreductase [Nocardioides baekrokdamisoli]BBH16488.1 oxidase [Nocardioides baekrokdamisoli]